MELAHSKKTDTPFSPVTSPVKQEPQNEDADNFNVESVRSATSSDSSFLSIKSELESEDERIEKPSKKRKNSKKSHSRDNKNKRKHNEIDEEIIGRKLELTELPCIVNIKSPDALGRHFSNHDGTLDASNATGEADDLTALNEALEQNSSNSDLISKVYEVLVNIQSTLTELKAGVAENSKKIDTLQSYLPQPLSWENVKCDFKFPLKTEEHFLEFEAKLQNNELATKLVVHLTSRTYKSWKEMILLCLKHMISGNVAVLYNLNGVKGTKKKFRDTNMCNILVECVQYKFKEATTHDILKKISITLASSKDWIAPRNKKK